jgi:hypothetical protein
MDYEKIELSGGRAEMGGDGLEVALAGGEAVRNLVITPEAPPPLNRRLPMSLNHRIAPWP